MSYLSALGAGFVEADTKIVDTTKDTSLSDGGTAVNLTGGELITKKTDPLAERRQMLREAVAESTSTGTNVGFKEAVVDTTTTGSGSGGSGSGGSGSGSGGSGSGGTVIVQPQVDPVDVIDPLYPDDALPPPLPPKKKPNYLLLGGAALGGIALLYLLFRK